MEVLPEYVFRLAADARNVGQASPSVGSSHLQGSLPWIRLPRRLRLANASGRTRPRRPGSWRFATPVSVHYLLSMMQAQLSWLREFASSLRPGQREWQAAPDSEVRSQER